MGVILLTEHYYTENPSSKSAPKKIEATLRGNNMAFVTDVGVFSKNDIDFGTKHLIESFTFPDTDGDIIDVGCGYGPIGLALAKDNPKRSVILVDQNERALALAKENKVRNQVANASIVKSDLFEKLLLKENAAILSNPPVRAGKKVVYKLFRDAHNYLKVNGELWIVIQKKQGAPSAKKELESIFGNVDVIERSKGYFIFRMKKVDSTV